MKNQDLISPLDNRYDSVITDLAANFSETNLNKTRFEIEIEWINFLTLHGGKSFSCLSASATALAAVDSGISHAPSS